MTIKKTYSYISAYNDKYRKYAIGMVQRYMQIEQTLKDDKEFDLLTGSEEYKFYFSDEAGMDFNLLAFKKDTIYTVAQQVKNALKNNHFIRKLRGR